MLAAHDKLFDDSNEELRKAVDKAEEMLKAAELLKEDNANKDWYITTLEQRVTDVSIRDQQQPPPPTPVGVEIQQPRQQPQQQQQH